jgi:hypothetical protein
MRARKKLAGLLNLVIAFGGWCCILGFGVVANHTDPGMVVHLAISGGRARDLPRLPQVEMEVSTRGLAGINRWTDSGAAG